MAYCFFLSAVASWRTVGSGGLIGSTFAFSTYLLPPWEYLHREPNKQYPQRQWQRHFWGFGVPLVGIERVRSRSGGVFRKVRAINNQINSLSSESTVSFIFLILGKIQITQEPIETTKNWPQSSSTRFKIFIHLVKFLIISIIKYQSSSGPKHLLRHLF